MSSLPWRRATGGGLPRAARNLLRPKTRGQAVVEFALLVPVLVLLLLAAVDFGRLFFSYVQISNAAREGAAVGTVSPTDTAGISAKAQQERDAQGQTGESAFTINVTCTDSAGTTIPCATAQGGAGTGNRLTVVVTEQFTFMTPFINGIFGGGLNMSASATTAVLGVAANGGSAGSTCTTPPTANPFAISVSGMTVSVDATSSTPSSGTCAISGYNWDWAETPEPFPPITGKLATYTYSSPGTYIITLEVTNQAGTATVQGSATVGVTPTPTPTPTPAPTPTPTPAPTPTPTPAPTCTTVPDFTFTANGSHKTNFFGSYTGSPAPVTWSWTFGDGGTATGQNPPRHDYAGAGPYTVTLTVTNGTCVKTITKSVNV